MRNILLATTISLLLFNSCKKEDDILPTNNVGTETDSLIADFNFEIIIKENEPNVYQFKNLSKNATSYKWYFNNSDSSTLFEPSVQFPSLDTFYVKLVAINEGKASSKFRAIIVKNIIALDSNKNPIYGNKPIANFSILYNIDSNNVVFFENHSKDFIKAKWYFNDVYSNDAINTSHIYSGSLNNVKAKLVVEDKYGQKDSIQRQFNLEEGDISMNNVYFLLTNANPVRYKFYQDDYINNFYSLTGISFTNYYDKNKQIFTKGLEKTHSTTEPQSVIVSIDLPNRTIYKRLTTFDVNDVQSKISSLPGNYTFNERSLIETGFPNTNFNDTILSVIQSAQTQISLNDATLNHSFSGYLSSYSNSTYLDFRIQNDAYPQLNIYGHQYLRFSINSNTVNAEKYSSVGSKSNSSSTLIYNGQK